MFLRSYRNALFSVPPGETASNKSALEQRKDEIERLKNEIAEKEKRLKLTRLQNEIKELTARVDEKERLVRKRQVNTNKTQRCGIES